MQKFFTGDVVNYVGRSDRSWVIDETHIIHECEYNGTGIFSYSTNKGAWFSDRDFKLVRKADKLSFKELDLSLVHEDEDEEWED